MKFKLEDIIEIRSGKLATVKGFVLERNLVLLEAPKSDLCAIDTSSRTDITDENKKPIRLFGSYIPIPIDNGWHILQRAKINILINMKSGFTEIS